MKHRKRIREATYHNLLNELDAPIGEAYKDLTSSGCEVKDLKSFQLGYLCGMDNPHFESVKSAVEVMRLFGDLDKDNQGAVMLIIDGLKYRRKLKGE